jgi:hypothetical protein
MSQNSIIPHYYSSANLAPRQQPPKHLQRHGNSDSSSSSNNTTDTRATTPEPQCIPTFPLRTLLRDQNIYSTHKFVDFRQSPLPHYRPFIHDNKLVLPLILFRHITHAHSLEHQCFCKDPSCTTHH